MTQDKWISEAAAHLVDDLDPVLLDSPSALKSAERALSQAYERGQVDMRERAAQHLNDKAEEMRAGGTVTAQTMARIFDDQSAAIRSLPIDSAGKDAT